MLRFIGWILVLLAIFVGQTMIMPRWVPFTYLPDLSLLTIILIGFFSSDGRALLIGFLLGCFQGWLHGSGLLPFAISRTFAGAQVTWLRNKWLWSGLPAIIFCVTVCTFSSELLLALLLSLYEKNLSPLLMSWQAILTEVFIGSILAIVFCTLWRKGREER